MNCPENLKYAETHEWAAIDGNSVTVGLTAYAVEQLGDLVFINLPEEGDEVEAGESFAEVESVKAVSEVMSPVTGTVAEVNEDLLDNPGLPNEDPYGAWLVKIEGTEGADELMDAAAYAATLDEE